MYRYYWEYIDAVSVGDRPSNVYIYDNAYYNKRGSSGVCIALAATIVYTLDVIVWVGYDRACLLDMNMNMT